MLMNANEYLETVEQVKQEIRTAQYRAAVQVNCELLRLYHAIGTVINAHKVWGSRFVENLAADIKLSFPEMKGYSVRNLKYMAKFAEAYSADEFVQQPVAQIPWGHNVVLLDKVADKVERLWYAEQSRKNGWSRNVLVHQIESDLYQRQALAEKVSNFELRLPSPQSELAIQTMKDPYIFDFIPFKTDMLEREIEEALVKDVTKLLLELGTGFAFLGNQYHLNVGGDDFYIDLLFYNLNLRCYVVIELKTGEFKPEYAGQLKNGFLLAFNALRNQGFSFLSAELMHIKTLRMRNYYFYGKTLFEHSFFINVPCRLLQTPAVSDNSAFDAACWYYKTQHTVRRFFESSALRCTLCDTPLLF